jgi:hypothetical protein
MMHFESVFILDVMYFVPLLAIADWHFAPAAAGALMTGGDMSGQMAADAP